ncbi:hypothetical protein GF386_02730 [Candidatus Pacearchaeota archaeon]|nr:hypothetical protein [Candidatus Pacearchaeota archaeon]MBD3283064.1 hypothetical protein [Candidatus Pacearchaeota archaeon]
MGNDYVVIEYGSGTGFYSGSRFITSSDALNSTCIQTGIWRVVDSGISMERARELVVQVPFGRCFQVLLNESASPKTGEVDREVLEMRLRGEELRLGELFREAFSL